MHLTLICYQTHFYSVDIVEFVTVYFVIHDGGMYGGVEGPPHIFLTSCYPIWINYEVLRVT